MKVTVYIEAEDDDERDHLTNILVEQGVSTITDLDDLAQAFTEQARESLQYSGIRLKETTILIGRREDDPDNGR